MQRPCYYYILGGIILYITGVTSLARRVDVISPPIITKASGEYSADLLNAIGNSPPIAVRAVSRTGRNLISPASIIASLRGVPFSRN